MKVLVVGPFPLDSIWAYALNTIKMADAFARLGHDVSLLCRNPVDPRVAASAVAKALGLSRDLRWILLGNRYLGLPIGERWSYLAATLLPLIRFRPDLVYSRDPIFPRLSTRFGYPTVIECHEDPARRLDIVQQMDAVAHRRALRMCVTNSSYLADVYSRRGISSAKLLFLPNAIDLRLFSRPLRLATSPFSQPGPHIVYTGHLYEYKGIATALAAAQLLPECCFHFVGGHAKDVSRQQARAAELNLTNTRFVGHLPHAQLAPYLWHADMLLLPPSARHWSAVSTSPLKLGEYLASGTPIVASAIPALKSLVTDREVAFFTPDDPADLAATICRVLADASQRRQMSEAAMHKAQSMSYESRAAAILRSLESVPQMAVPQSRAVANQAA